MAARATWKGYLKISLVNIPVRVFPATESAAYVQKVSAFDGDETIDALAEFLEPGDGA